MSQAIVVIDTSRIHPGSAEEVELAIKELAGFVAANEPRVIAYQVYFDEQRTQMTVLQIHPDSESAEYHMQVAAPIFARFKGLLDLATMDVYGAPSDELLQRLRRKAELLGGSPVVVHHHLAGFYRVSAREAEPR